MSQTLPEIIKQCYRDKTGQRSRHLSRFIMLILLAESKTMSANQLPVNEEEFRNNIPLLEPMADSIMDYFAGLTPADISAQLGISMQLAIKAHGMAYDFPHKLTGYRALFGFTGEAYRSLDAKSLSQNAVNNAEKDLRIISSVYGILRPQDIIKPYRCEFNKPLAADHKTAIQLFKPKVTTALVNYIKENKIQDVVNLLPGEAEKLIDLKIIRAFSKVHKICFQTVTDSGGLKTPITGRLKELRGLMCRMILEQGIDSFDQLKRLDSDQFIFSPEDSKPLLPVFIASE